MTGMHNGLSRFYDDAPMKLHHLQLATILRKIARLKYLALKAAMNKITKL
jgi:hypothetical protein